ncbi:MAG TPA: M56 family metallopeptidase [Tepidisphaeraceae bacterium]|nr:M56 family metallopeptidase [Tepidisphaeraceae bacterium]
MIESIAQALFNWLWQTSWQGAILAWVVGLVTWSFRKSLAPGAKQLLWLLVFVRLAMPILPGSPFSIFKLLKPDAVAPPRLVQALPLPIRSDSPPPIARPSSPEAMPLAAQRAYSPDLILVAAWLIGFVIAWGRVLWRHFGFTRRLKQTAVQCDASTLAIINQYAAEQDMQPINAMISDLVSTPAVIGAISPHLLLPARVLKELDPAELRPVVMHELEHIRRRHLAIDWILTLIQSAHWFNPAAWWAHRRVRASRELICDQAVLARLDDESSRKYGLTLLNMASALGGHPAGVTIAAFAREPALLRQRIEQIASGKRSHLAWLGLSFIIATALLFLTAPKQSTAQVDPAIVQPSTAPTSPSTESSKPGLSNLIVWQNHEINDLTLGPIGSKATQSERQARADELVERIKNTIDPKSWDQPETKVSIKGDWGQLIVTQTLEHQAEIKNLIDELRLDRGTQIKVSARLIELAPGEAESLPSAYDPQNKTMWVDDETVENLLKKGAKVLASPSLQLSDRRAGQIKITDGIDKDAMILAVMGTAWEDLRYITLDISLSGAAKTDKPLQMQRFIAKQTMKVPDGGSAFFRVIRSVSETQPDGTEKAVPAQLTDNEFWLAVRVSIIIKPKDGVQQFPVLSDPSLRR